MKVTKGLVWTLLFLLLLLGIDQFFVHVPPLHPAHAALSRFYQDFRGRLFVMTFGQQHPAPSDRGPGPAVSPEKPSQVKPPPATSSPDKGPSIETLIERSGSEPEKARTSPPQRFIYTDATGALQFADSLQDVPAEYRDQAQPMSGGSQ